jgi:glutamate/tyrosine decarboxylase-like PLP-dependent enzyme
MKFSDIKRSPDGGFCIGPVSNVPDISETCTTDINTLFLGPKAENHELLTQLINRALAHIYEYRQSYFPQDPVVITKQIKESPSYQNASRQIQAAFDELLDFLLTHATPYFSVRYQGHMLWDNTLPAMAAYFATMLHNPNNVCFQASSSTTPLEMVVGWDLCQMVGFEMNCQIEPWAHLTADGTVANIESLWVARELHSLPFAMCELLIQDRESDKQFSAAIDLEVTCCDGRVVKLLEANNWQLLNLSIDEILEIPKRAAKLCNVEDVLDVWNALVKLTLNTHGWQQLERLLLNDSIQHPIIVVPSTKHYSWPKAAAITGYGVKAMVDIHVDAEARMDIGRLKNQLDLCLKNKIPVAMLLVVCGSTEESAVDNIAEVLALRELYRKRGLNFIIHVDAAWGGYMLSVVRNHYRLQPLSDAGSDETELFTDELDTIPASDYVLRQLKHIRFCDSITIVPHKWGYVQYPVGSVLYRNSESRHLTTFTGAYIGRSSSVIPEEPNVGIFGIEGSRAGAAAAAVYLSHRCLRPTIHGYGKIISECLFNTRMFHIRLLALNSEDLGFVVVPLVQLPAEKNNSDIGAQMEFIQHRMLSKSREEIQRDAEAWRLFRELGPDQNILDYGFNIRLPDGSINADTTVYNEFNERIYSQFSMHFDAPEPLRKTPFILTKTTFLRQEYGDLFMDTFARRLGLLGQPMSLECLRSVVMDPYVTHTAHGSYFVEIIKLIRQHVSDIAKQFHRVD